MLLRRRAPAAIALATAVALTAAACGSSGGGSGGSANTGSDTAQNTAVGKAGGTFRLGIGEPAFIDPYDAQESEGLLVTKQLFDQLVSINAQNKVVPAVASSWSKNGDCTSWTFKIKDGQKFSNGETVDANAFIRGMTRSASKAAASDVAYHMAGIVGFDALQAGTAKTFTGLSAPDPLTLQVKLSAPDCEFYEKTLQPVMSPVPTVAGAPDNKTFNDLPIGNGPFKMLGPWKHDQSITLVRNDAYTDGPKALLDRVDISILPAATEQELEYKNFQNGDADFARIPPELQPQAKATYEPKGDWIKENTFGINYLEVAVTTSPLNSVAAREAVSYAIDRDAIIAGVFKGFQTKATSFVPPPFAAEGTYQPGICASCVKQDPVKAKALAKQAGFTKDTTINLYFNTGGGHEAWVQAVAQELKTVLGVKVNIPSFPFAQLLDFEKKPKNSGMYRSAWSADYPTADNFLYPLLGTKPADAPGDNRGRYSNPKVDALISQARATQDDTKRAGLYKQAEKIAIGQDLADIPLWYRTQFRVYDSSKFTGVNLDFFENPSLATIGLK